MKQLLICLLVILPSSLCAQLLDPITWTADLTTEGETATLTLTAKIEKGWHLYATELPAELTDGPDPTTVNYSTLTGLEAVGELTPSESPIKVFDQIYDSDLMFWENQITLTQQFNITDANYALVGTIDFMACNDQNCIPPSSFDFKFGDVEEDEVAAAPVAGTFNPTNNQWWQPVINESETSDIEKASLWSIFLWGFLGGLIALLTPCVWPMIPLTVSFFLKKNSSRAKSVREACIYGASIIVIYLLLGLIVTVIFGASKLNDLSTNAVFNLIFFALLVVFAVSFFGAFDIKLPSKWSNSIDSKAESATGLLSIFFMAFTLALVSFSCTGPIIGTLLVEAATMGNYIGPAIGMGAFALALAIPFALFAMFPSMLKEMPRSGGWLNSVKVVLGFRELARSLKFLSVADLA
ncbi:MAG: sulfite exporter TauE/SafE family protein, partial [Muribaculaceae bacterium]|nr:sulfite exporter TauE/SafE family protein [Muribaculaceae bacterium]